MEKRFGVDFSDVRVHSDGAASQMNRDLNARAFTYGKNIYFGGGNDNPTSTSLNKRLLAHELMHVVQNRKSNRAVPIRRVCRPPRTRANTHPNEGQSTGGRQLPANRCLWILYGFHIDNSEFMTAFTPVVNQLAEFMRMNQNVRLQLLGLSDCFGSSANNAILGNARSRNVENAFPSNLHGRIDRLPSNGRSYVVLNDTPLHRSLNRSVQIQIITTGGLMCPAQIPLLRQLTPATAGGCSTGSRGVVLAAARAAAPLAITALARVRNWRNNQTTRRLLDLYYSTTNNAQRQAAANRIEGMLNRIIPNLQRPTLDCVEPGHWAYARVCPRATIADSGGVTVVQMPTFCIPQFVNLTSLEARAVTVIHEFSHRLSATVDHNAYYTSNNCLPTVNTNGLTHTQRLIHADSFSCFVGTVAIQAPQ